MNTVIKAKQLNQKHFAVIHLPYRLKPSRPVSALKPDGCDSSLKICNALSAMFMQDKFINISNVNSCSNVNIDHN